jgi:M6 family metalloprotease-like protein
MPPKPGSGAVFPLSAEEIVRLGIGQPSPPLPRFIEKDRDGNTIIKMNGSYAVPVLLGEFPNLAGTHPREDFQTELFDGPWPTETLTDFFHEISYDQFTATGTVYGWYELPENNSYYQGNDNGFGSDYPTNAPGFVYQLCELADPDVDFSLYDNDGPDGIANSGDDDGFVDNLWAVHSGQGGECGGAWLWSHSWALQYGGAPVYVTDDDRIGGGSIRINSYILMPGNACNGTTLIEIGVFCHEFGHGIGLPDLYDTDYSSDGIGLWGLMSGGSWGADGHSPSRPAQACVWSKARMGWLVPQSIPRNFEDVELPRMQDNPTALKIWRDGDTSGPEYFLVSNRQKTGFDERLPGAGILIWHIDDTRYSNSNDDRRLVDLEAADDNDNNENPSDPFPGSLGSRFFNWSTSPNSNDYNGDTTQVAVNFIGDSDSVMTIGLLAVSYPMIEFENYSIDDSGGDNDGVVDIGETVDITFTVHNHSSTAAESVWAFILSSDPDLSFPVDSVYVGPIDAYGDADNAGQPFTMEVNAASDVHMSEFTIELIGTEMFYFASSEEFLIGHPTLLLVMDDGDDDYSSYYRAALDSLAVPYAMSDVYQSGSPADSLEPFDTLIWFTGRATEDILSQEEQDSLRSFVELGGDLFISGQNVAEDLSANGEDFLEEVLGVTYGSNSFDPILNGVQTNQVGEDLVMIVTAGSGGANNQTSRDVLIPVAGTQAAVVYDTTTGVVGGVTRYTNPTDSRVVFFGFGFESINRSNPSDSTQVTRLEVMENVIDFLMGEVGIGDAGSGSANLPRAFTLSQNYPNPFNPMTTISFTVPGRNKVTLDVYDLRGRRVRGLLDKFVMPGYYSVQWDGRDDSGRKMASGVYFYRLEAGEEVLTRRMLLVK